MSTIPQALDRFQRAIVSKRNATCGFCGRPTTAGLDFAALDNGVWLGVCSLHANSVVEQCKARVIQIQTQAQGLNELQMKAVDAHCPANLADVLTGNAPADELRTAAALDSAVRVIAMFKGENAPAPVRSNKFAGKCADCGKTVAEGAGRLEGSKGAWVTRHLEGQCPAAEAPVPVTEGLDLSPLKAYTSNGKVRFGVPGGDTRLKVRVNFHDNGVIYVNDCAVYGERQTYGMQRPGEAYKGKVEDALKAILADPQAAVIRYAELTSRCGVCNRHLEKDVSVLQGMGPVCAGKF